MTLEQLSFIAQILASIASLVAIIFVYKQLKQMNFNILTSTYQNIYVLVTDIDKFFFHNIQYKKYFYGNEPFDKLDKDEFEKLLSVAELLCDTFQNIYFQKSCILEKAFLAQTNWMTGVYNTSPILREYLLRAEQNGWYAQEFINHIKQYSNKMENITDNSIKK